MSLFLKVTQTRPADLVTLILSKHGSLEGNPSAQFLFFFFLAAFINRTEVPRGSQTGLAQLEQVKSCFQPSFFQQVAVISRR